MRKIEKHAATYHIAFAMKAVIYRSKQLGIDLKPTILKRAQKMLASLGDITSIKANPDFNTDELYKEGRKLHHLFFKRDGELKCSAFFSAKYDLSKIALSLLDMFPPINIDEQEDYEYAEYFCRLLKYNYVVGGKASKMPVEQIDYYKILFKEIYELLPMTEEDWKDFDLMFPDRTTEETLQKQLRNALEAEDYLLACQVRNKINELKE